MTTFVPIFNKRVTVQKYTTINFSIPSKVKVAHLSSRMFNKAARRSNLERGRGKSIAAIHVIYVTLFDLMLNHRGTTQKATSQMVRRGLHTKGRIPSSERY
jgi:hypothetical protein